MKAKCIWFTGLPCSGKTTLALALKELIPLSIHLDGDVLRNSVLGKGIGFTPEERRTHLLKVGAMAKIMVDSGATTICSFVSPYQASRDEVRAMFKDDEFFEVFVKAPVEECIERDVKGMYAKALTGEIPNFTGIQAPYEEPLKPNLVLRTDKLSQEQCIEVLEDALEIYRPRAAFFIGRWNGVFHNGHNHIIQKKIDEGLHVIMAVRDVKPDEKNPWPATKVKKMLEYRWKDNPYVEVIIIPDVSSVEYGRGVGYEVNEIKVTEKIAGISGTECRKRIVAGDDSWKVLVPKEIVEYFESE